VRALGALQVSVGGAPVPPGAWGAARPRELLVHLLLHPEGRTREQVGLAFWPEASSAQLRNNFHVTLHRLRKALGSRGAAGVGAADWVLLEGDRYRVDPAAVEAFDAADFERDVGEARRALRRQQAGAADALARALDAYAGDLLDGEPAGDWHVAFRERLQRLYVEGRLALGTARAADGRHAEAADAFRRALASDALHEDALRGLLRAHLALGERAQALRAYQSFADRLRREFGAEPDGRTTALVAPVRERVGG
jgi:DNA-binding SARP family transcriptional activator